MNEEMVCSAQWHAANAAELAAMAQARPHVLMRPKLSIDGNQWCALYGDSLQHGVAGFGDSPALAMVDFDKNWTTALPTASAAREGSK